METEGVGRISVSVDVLRNELAQLELRIVDRIATSLDQKADKTIVAEHDKRITSLELSRASREHLSQDVNDMDRRVMSLEANANRDTGVTNFKRWLLPAAVSLIGASWWIPILFR